jgi:hypothetical protein
MYKPVPMDLTVESYHQLRTVYSDERIMKIYQFKSKKAFEIRLMVLGIIPVAEPYLDTNKDDRVLKHYWFRTA